MCIHTGYGVGGPNVGFGGPGPGNIGFTVPGQQILTDPLVANVAMQYGSAIVGTGRQIVDREFEKYVPVSRLKYYFAVDTSYVMRKLRLLFFPFTHSVSKNQSLLCRTLCVFSVSTIYYKQKVIPLV